MSEDIAIVRWQRRIDEWEQHEDIYWPDGGPQSEQYYAALADLGVTIKENAAALKCLRAYLKVEP